MKHNVVCREDARPSSTSDVKSSVFLFLDLSELCHVNFNDKYIFRNNTSSLMWMRVVDVVMQCI